MAGNKLVKIMQHAGKQAPSETVDLVFGVVTNASPLTIKIDNRFEVDENFLLLSSLVKPKRAESSDILLWRGLITGDRVRLLRVNSGQLFYVIEREE